MSNRSILRFSFLLAILALLVFAKSVPAKTHSNGLFLQNKHVSVEIDKTTGSILSIRDKDRNVLYSLDGIGFIVTTDKGTVSSEAAARVKKTNEKIAFSFQNTNFTINLNYHLGKKDKFIEKWLEIKEKNNKPYFLKEVVLEDAELGAQFKEIHFHDDQTIWHCPINLFLRSEKGGLFAGLEYPYWQMDIKDNRGFRLGYRPNYFARENEINISEKYFLGVYSYEGIYRYSQGVYPGKKSMPYLDYRHTGLHQHFKGGQLPVSPVEAEVLDWGEVWAMQQFMRHVLPDLPLPEDGYWIWQNGWWAGLFDPKPEILDQLKLAGVHDIMTAHTWYGRGNHPIAEPYLSQMRIEPMGFPKDDGLAGMPGPAGPAAGLHVEHAEVALDKFTPGLYTHDFQAPPAMEAFYQYGQKIGVHVSSFSLPGIYFDNRPDWASIDENGNISQYIYGRKVSCPACDPYMEHMLEVLHSVFTKYQPRWWGFDGRWLSYWEVPAYRPGPKGLGFDTCYAENHGHLPGDNFYKEWINIQGFIRKLRERYPRVCLEQYLGLKRGGPWAMRYLNADDNYFETSGAVMNRFQTWHNQNDRFRPCYKNSAAVFGETTKDFQYNFISTLSATAYCQIGPGFKGLALEENRQFLKKWRNWATKNHEYLKVKRDLFDCPGFVPVDGSAHIIKDRGFLFLFPVAKDPKTTCVSVIMNRWLGLDENPGARYKITEIYPQENRLLGIYGYGEEFHYNIPVDSAVILSVEPARTSEQAPKAVLELATKEKILRAFQEGIFEPAEFLTMSEEQRITRILSKRVVASSPAAKREEPTQLGKIAQPEYLNAVRPGLPGESPFWNVNSFRFMYAPAFDFKPLESALEYRFTAAAADGKNYTFQAEKPWATLTPLWGGMPTGQVQLKVEAIKDGQVVGVAGQRNFYRAAMYNGPYHKPVMDYQQSARLGLTKMFNRDYIRQWLTSSEPHPNYPVPQTPWAYPAKLIGAIVAGSATYATLTPRPPDADEVLQIGRNAADKLIELSLPKGSLMEYFPQTYNNLPNMKSSVIMLVYPAEAAMAYLDFYDVTGRKKYFDAAKRIANTYKKLQLPNGTWYLMMDNDTAKELYPHFMVPTLIVEFMDRMVQQYGMSEYRSISARAMDWIMNNPLKTYNWAAQFEDAGRPLNLYESFSPAQVLELALYLFDHADERTDNITQAQELLRFAEDQFVVWDKPMKYTRYDSVVPELKTENLIFPCVMEQYTYWVPVNFSSSHLIETYQKAYEVTGRKLYLDKAKDLANTLTVVQKKHFGEYSAHLTNYSETFEPRNNVWTNCAVYTARGMNELGKMLNDKTRMVIENHTTRTDTEGNLIQAHDGGISRFNGKFYWYGTSYAGNPTGKYGMIAPRLWNGVLVYSSDNLVDWTYEGLAVERPKKGWGNLGTSGRPHVIYNDKTKKYVMWYWFHLQYPAVIQMVAVADSPTGPFTVLGPREVGTDNGFASDHNIFKDDDGRAYLIYTDHETPATRFADWTNGRYAIRIDSLTDDYIESNKDGVYAFDHGCEAPSMTKYKGKYIVAASGVAGWGGTENYYTLADSPLGPYGEKKVLTGKNKWGGQLSSLLFIKESDTLMAMCDQWWLTRDEHHTNHPEPGTTDLNESRYLWLPVEFNPETEIAKMPFRKNWKPF